MSVLDCYLCQEDNIRLFIITVTLHLNNNNNISGVKWNNQLYSKMKQVKCQQILPKLRGEYNYQAALKTASKNVCVLFRGQSPRCSVEGGRDQPERISGDQPHLVLELLKQSSPLTHCSIYS